MVLCILIFTFLDSGQTATHFINKAIRYYEKSIIKIMQKKASEISVGKSAPMFDLVHISFFYRMSYVSSALTMPVAMHSCLT